MKPKNKDYLRDRKPKSVLGIDIKNLGFAAPDLLYEKYLKCFNKEIPSKKNKKLGPKKGFERLLAV